MQACWNFYCFDYERYLRLRPLLRAATTPEAFAALGQSPEVEAIVEALLEETLTLESARNALAQALCCVDAPLALDASFSRFVAALARRKGAEDAAEMLGALIGGGKPVEAWMAAPDGMVGLLTPEETRQLYAAFAASAQKRGRLSPRGRGSSSRRMRRGGLVGVCISFLRHLFNAGPLPEDMLLLLRQFLEEAQTNRQGLAIVAA